MGATRVTCMIMLILAGASFMSTSMAYTGIPSALAPWVDALHLSSYALIAALTLMYIVLGTALDGISMIVLTTAMVIPMIKQAGFDLVWFGIFLVLVVEMAEVSPPVGFNLFVLQTMSGKDQHRGAGRAAVFPPACGDRCYHHRLSGDRDGAPKHGISALISRKGRSHAEAVCHPAALATARPYPAGSPPRRPSGTCRRLSARQFALGESRRFSKDVEDASGGKLQIACIPAPRCSRRRRSSAPLPPAKRRSARC